MKNKFNLVMVLLTLIILFVFVFGVNGIDQIVEVIQTVNPLWLVIAVLCMVVYWALEAYLLFIVTKNTGSKCRFRDILDVSMIGQLFNCITPFASGGQPMQAYYMKRKDIPLTSATSALMGKFIAYQITLIIYSTVLLVMRLSYFTQNVSGFAYLTLIGYIVNFAVMGFFFFIIYFNKPTIRLIQWGTKILGKLRILRHPEKLYKKIDDSVNDFSIGFFALIKNKKLILRSFVLTVAQLTAYMMIPYFLMLAFGLHTTDIITVLAAQAFTMCISSFMPLPGGSGAAEGSFYIFFAMFFGPATGVAMLLWRGITYYLNILVGAAFSLKMGLTGKKADEIEAEIAKEKSEQ